MRLIVDLRFNAAVPRGSEHERIVTLNELAALAASPGELLATLRDRRYDEVIVMRDADVPMSGVQAGGAGLAGLARSRQFTIADERRQETRGRASYLLRASGWFVWDMMLELARSVATERRAARIARKRLDLPSRAAAVRSVTYLRGEPSLNWMGAQVGGAATHTAGVIRGFTADGVEVRVYASQRPEGIGEVSFTEVRPRRLFQIAHWLTFVAYSEQLVQAAGSPPPDVVYQRYALGSYAGLELARRLGVPLILEFNGSEIWTARHWGSGRVRLERTLAALERRNLEDASLVIVNSEVMREQLIDDGIDPSTVLVNPNGVDVEQLASVRARTATEWRDQLDLPQAPTVGFIGTFGLWHGVKVLPSMVAEVARHRPDVRWILVGDGQLRAEVQAEVRERGLERYVDFTGVVPHERAIELLAACEVCVSPHVPNPDGSRFFGSPTKLFEYMGLGKPIVASDLEQIGEVLDHERSALLCEPGDAQGAAEAVIRLIEDAALAARLGAAALADAETEYSWLAHTRRILAAISDGAASPTA